MWEAVEIAPGVYDHVYLNKVENIINRLGKAGIHTLIDGHQDAISRGNCGEGMPKHVSDEVLSKMPHYCFTEWFDWALASVFKLNHVCVPIKDYHFK
jgi:hypothetical protein